MIIEHITVYVDLDGVLADFPGAVKERFGREIHEIPKNVLWSKIQHYNDNHEPWFYSLPKMRDADILWGYLTENFKNVEILSASGTTPRDAPGQKKAWVGNHFGWDVRTNIVSSASEKAAFAKPNALLIDDTARAVNPFIKAGGIAVLHTSARSTISALNVMVDDWK